MEYETNDGWDLDNIEPLYNFIEAYDELADDVYELKNCVRTKSLVEMRNSLLATIAKMKEALDSIYDDDVVVELNNDDEVN